MNDELNQHLTDSDIQHLSFIKAFQSLLNESIEPESKEIRDTKLACEALKFQIRDILERINALDVLNDNISVISICEHDVDLPLRRYIEQCKKPWLKDKLTIALMGHLKTGKTSAMNCYFGEDFPTSTEEATALATYLYYSDNPNQTASLVDKEGGVQKINSEQLQLFSLEKSFNFPFARMFSYIAKGSKHPALSDMTFIDTPGLFSSNSEHAYTTYKVLDYCDVIFWFVDCRKSISEKEITFIKEQIGNKPVYIIFSFVDARGTTESGTHKAQEVIKQKLTEAGIAIQGYLQFGRKNSAQERFKKEFGETIESLGKNHQAVNPIHEVISLLLALQELVLSMQQDATKMMNEQKNNLEEIGNNIKGATRSVQSAFSSVGDRFSNMIDTLDNRCANVTFCTGGAYNTLRSNVSQLASSLQSIAEAWDNVDYSIIAQYGTLSANIERLDDIIKRLDAINSDINNILNKFKS